MRSSLPLRAPSARLLIGIAATLVVAGQSLAQSPTATATVTFHDEPARGFRQGDDFLLPLSGLSTLGWSATRRNETAHVLTDDGTVDLPVRRVGGVECISLRALAKQQGAITGWTSGFDAFEMMSPLGAVTVSGSKIAYDGRLAVAPRTQIISNPTRIIVDLDGARLTRSTRLDLDSHARVLQYRPNTVRIIVETTEDVKIPPGIGPGASSKIDFNPPPPPAKPVVVPTNPAQGGANSTDNGAANATPAAVDLSMRVELEGPTATLLTLNAPTAALKGKPVISKPQPDVLVILLPGIVGAFPADFSVTSDAVKSVSSQVIGNSTQVRLELSSAMGGEVWTDGRGVAIQLLRPADANGIIAGKVIVIDAGHGGRDKGCSLGALLEKDLTLQIAKLTAAELANRGATVLMTRKDDSYPTLTQRPDLANRNHADLFISIHINSPGTGRKSPSGTEIYYHKKDPISRLLGECIMKFMVGYARVPNLGVKSDQVLYNSGLAILRGSKMPAVLVEVGYITHPTDRARMTDKSFQAQVARSIADGVRIYLGDSPR